MAKTYFGKLGWLPDFPDFRDFTPGYGELTSALKKLGQKDSVKTMLRKVGIGEVKKKPLPTAVDLRAWCSPIENQGELGSCTANAGVGMVEYFENRTQNRFIDASRLFLYKATRNLMHAQGDTGAYLRLTMAAMVLFGVAPEEFWPYEADAFDDEPTAFCYAFAQNYQSIQYYRLDPVGVSESQLLQQIKVHLAAGLPPMFGFTVYRSIGQATESGKIPFPAPGEKVAGGHAVMAVGYRNDLKIKNESGGKTKETVGALLIRNSWGEEWGDKGYGWLPYEYVLRGLALDWWAMLKNEWVDLGVFG